VSLADDVLARAEAAAEPVATPPLAELLEQVGAYVRRYVVLSPAQAAAIALWVAHTHAIDAAETTPYLHVTSPEKRSGKTRLLEALELVVRAPVRAADVSDAVLFRILSESPRTLLLDEADAIFSPRSAREELRGLLNASWRRGSPVYRMVGEGAKMRPVAYDAFGPKAIAGIGELPDTVADRAFRIRLERKSRNEEAERFRRRVAETEAEPLRGALEAWAETAIDLLAGARPALPAELDDRGQDAAEPLLAIAELAGGAWPERARRALVSLRAERDVEEESLGVRLLADCRAAFERDGAERLATAELLERLAADEEAPWAEWHGRPLTARGLARLLRPYGVRSKVVRIGEATPRGYERASFEDAWARYLPQNAPLSATSATLAQPCGFSPDSKVQHGGLCCTSKPAIFGSTKPMLRMLRIETL
jgi:hypothetical protein